MSLRDVYLLGEDHREETLTLKALKLLSIDHNEVFIFEEYGMMGTKYTTLSNEETFVRMNSVGSERIQQAGKIQTNIERAVIVLRCLAEYKLDEAIPIGIKRISAHPDLIGIAIDLLKNNEESDMETGKRIMNILINNPENLFNMCLELLNNLISELQQIPGIDEESMQLTSDIGDLCNSFTYASCGEEGFPFYINSALELSIRLVDISIVKSVLEQNEQPDCPPSIPFFVRVGALHTRNIKELLLASGKPLNIYAPFKFQERTKCDNVGAFNASVRRRDEEFGGKKTKKRARREQKRNKTRNNNKKQNKTK